MGTDIKDVKPSFKGSRHELIHGDGSSVEGNVAHAISNILLPTHSARIGPFDTQPSVQQSHY